MDDVDKEAIKHIEDMREKFFLFMALEPSSDDEQFAMERGLLKWIFDYKSELIRLINLGVIAVYYQSISDSEED